MQCSAAFVISTRDTALLQNEGSDVRTRVLHARRETKDERRKTKDALRQVQVQVRVQVQVQVPGVAAVAHYGRHDQAKWRQNSKTVSWRSRWHSHSHCHSRSHCHSLTHSLTVRWRSYPCSLSLPPLLLWSIQSSKVMLSFVLSLCACISFMTERRFGFG